MEKQPERLAVDIRLAAEMLSVSPRTIQNYIAAKLLPARKIGRRTVISARALENFLRTDQPSPVSKPSGASDAR
jgi:excisionase family DNA binding protein